MYVSTCISAHLCIIPAHIFTTREKDVYTYTDIRISSTQMHTYIYIYTDIHIRIGLGTKRVEISVYLYTHICRYKIYICIYMYMYMSIHTYIHAYMLMHVCVGCSITGGHSGPKKIFVDCLGITASYDYGSLKFTPFWEQWFRPTTMYKISLRRSLAQSWAIILRTSCSFAGHSEASQIWTTSSCAPFERMPILDLVASGNAFKKESPRKASSPPQAFKKGGQLTQNIEQDKRSRDSPGLAWYDVATLVRGTVPGRVEGISFLIAELTFIV